MRGRNYKCIDNQKVTDRAGRRLVWDILTVGGKDRKMDKARH